MQHALSFVLALLLAFLLAGCAALAPTAPRADTVQFDRADFAVALERTDTLVSTLVSVVCRQKGEECTRAKAGQKGWAESLIKAQATLRAPPPAVAPSSAFDLHSLIESLGPLLKLGADIAL